MANGGAFPSALIEAELFGAKAGAYTGAHRARDGRFELADTGTRFLGEIGNRLLPGQAKWLRALESGEFSWWGSARTRCVKVRVFSATRSDLSPMIREARFRENLLFRPCVIEIRLPRLAERPGDILALAEHVRVGGARLTKGVGSKWRQCVSPAIKVRDRGKGMSVAVLA